MVDVYVASAFCKDNKGGNKAGVVLGRPDLNSAQKMEIAKEMGYSETAFVSDACKADFKLQYFTPTGEVTFDSKEHLEELSPDLKMISDLSKEKGVVGVHAFALNKGSDVTAICRNFAPLYGIDEESATGTSNCALACYLFKYYEKKTNYIFEQGYNMGEISRIVVNISYHMDIIDSVYVGGYGYLLGKKRCQCNL